MLSTKMKVIILANYLMLITILTISAKKHRHAPISRQKNDSWKIYHKNLDLRGTLRKLFFVQSALTAPNDNTICSPLSAMMPLAKLALGAEGTTQEELLGAIGLPKKSMISSDFRPIIAFMKHLPGVKLDIASKLYVSSSAHLQKTFTDEAREVFDFGVDKMDFQYPIFATQEINAWVSQQTNGVIKSILSPSDITPASSMVVVNAIYFNGKWNDAFEKIKNVKFHGPNVHKIITMMTRTGYYNYTVSEALGAELIKIPYKWEKAVFLIILPSSRTGLPLLLSELKIAPEVLDAAMSNMNPTFIQIIMPKFKIETELNLNDMYEKMGVKKMFAQRQSQLTQIVKDETLHVSKAKHKAYIDVNEYGTEAGAASGIGTVTSKLAQPVVTFKADRPFLFFILVNGQQLFSGTFVNPK